VKVSAGIAALKTLLSALAVIAKTAGVMLPAAPVAIVGRT
jgi:hypothetical protein